MCYRYISPDAASIVDYWELEAPPGLSFEACYNVAPTSPVPAVWPTAAGGLLLGLLRWGLIPAWWKQEKPPSLTFNARSEEAAQKPVWRDSFRQGRCLIPARGWYEWRTVERTNPETGRTIKAKEPFCLHRPAAPLLAFAGLKAQWRSPGGELVSSCAILTRAASPQLAFLHHRMPVVLPKELHIPWLTTQGDPAEPGRLLAQACEDIAYYRVGEAVNRVGVNNPDLMTPLPLS